MTARILVALGAVTALSYGRSIYVPGPPPPTIKASYDGTVYARTESGCTTSVYRVEEGHDTALFTLVREGWFDLVVCKVLTSDVAMVYMDDYEYHSGWVATTNDIALSFYLNGKLLKTYSTLDIAGSPTAVAQYGGPCYRAMVQNEVAGTRYKVLTAGGCTIYFDPNTGDISERIEPLKYVHVLRHAASLLGINSAGSWERFDVSWLVLFFSFLCVCFILLTAMIWLAWKVVQRLSAVRIPAIFTSICLVALLLFLLGGLLVQLCGYPAFGCVVCPVLVAAMGWLAFLVLRRKPGMRFPAACALGYAMFWLLFLIQGFAWWLLDRDEYGINGLFLYNCSGLFALPLSDIMVDMDMPSLLTELFGIERHQVMYDVISVLVAGMIQYSILGAVLSLIVRIIKRLCGKRTSTAAEA